MGNKKSTSAGAAVYVNFVRTLKITELTFKKVEKLLFDKSIQSQSTSICITLSEFVSLYSNNFIYDTEKNPFKDIHKVYLNALYDFALDTESSSSVNIYWVLLFLIPILENSPREKGKAFFYCTLKIHDSALNGKELKYYFDYYYKWNLSEAPSILYNSVTNPEEKEGYNKFIEKVATIINVNKVINETLNLLAAREDDLQKKRVVIQDIFLIERRIEYAFDFQKMNKELTMRFKPEDEQ